MQLCCRIRENKFTYRWVVLQLQAKLSSAKVASTLEQIGKLLRWCFDDCNQVGCNATWADSESVNQWISTGGVAGPTFLAHHVVAAQIYSTAN